MAIKINEDCISCGACSTECPNEAIEPGDEIYVIDPSRCNECVGFFDEEQCKSVCPVDACINDETRREDEATLIARARTMHPDQNFGDNFPSHFKK